ncbi:unnamed protein product [Brassicogethes aeneus]|uniref:Large ribosomal subunit protein mL52 n=1 Tax=Brassicogethes aeneus TaxID=1431903 RepID=A0A9P0F9U1_BRAAE|nr:unnamed protein product [Brassicogethes aeneus]
MFQKNLCSLIKMYNATKSIQVNRCVCSTPVYNINQKWRQERGLPLNPNACGVLTDGPDYTFLDGRLTPYGVRQKQRIIKQKEIAKQIIKLTGEVDFAVDRHKHLQMEEVKRKEQILNGKLKPKGVKLLH